MTLAKVKEQGLKKERNKAFKKERNKMEECKYDSQVDLHQRLEGCSPMK